MYPYSKNYNNERDLQLLELAIGGSKVALGELLQSYESFIYNITFRMVLSPYDAEDVTQEVFIKVMTKLDTFKRKSTFRTWVARITVNHVLNMKKKWLEERYKTKEIFENDLDSIGLSDLSGYSDLEKQILFEEARLGCLAGMLLCLAREQRIVYILGEIFSVPGNLAAKWLSLKPETYRKRLSRARSDLHNFLNEKCGLINKKNSCRCEKKTKGFIEAGWIDPKTMKFFSKHSKSIYDSLKDKDSSLKEVENIGYKEIMQKLPYIEKSSSASFIEQFIDQAGISQIFNL